MFSNFPNKVQICDVTTLMGLKIEMEFGTSQKNSKSSYVGVISVNHTKSNFSIRIPLYTNLGFRKKMRFSQICSNGHMRAKRVPRASRASEPEAVFANQTIQAWSKTSQSKANQPDQATHTNKTKRMG